MSTTAEVDDNIKRLANALKTAGAASAVLRYRGSDDSGEIVECSVKWGKNYVPLVTDDEDALGELDYSFLVTQLVDGKLTKTLRTRTAKFFNVLVDQCWRALESKGLHGWENNDGGCGVFTVYADGYARLTHEVNMTETVESSHTLGVDFPCYDYIQSVANCLQRAGATGSYTNYYQAAGYREIQDTCIDWPAGRDPTPVEKLPKVMSDEHVYVTLLGSNEVYFERAIEYLVWVAMSHVKGAKVDTARTSHGTLSVLSEGSAVFFLTDAYTAESKVLLFTFGPSRLANMPSAPSL